MGSAIFLHNDNKFIIKKNIVCNDIRFYCFSFIFLKVVCERKNALDNNT